MRSPRLPILREESGIVYLLPMWVSGTHQRGADSARARFSAGPPPCGGVLLPLPEVALHGTASPTPQDSCDGHMKQVGWQIQPLGWLLLLVIVATVCYVVARW